MFNTSHARMNWKQQQQNFSSSNIQTCKVKNETNFPSASGYIQYVDCNTPSIQQIHIKAALKTFQVGD